MMIFVTAAKLPGDTNCYKTKTLYKFENKTTIGFLQIIWRSSTLRKKMTGCHNSPVSIYFLRMRKKNVAYITISYNKK